MKHCITPNALTEEIFTNRDIKYLLFGDNGIYNRIINEAKSTDTNSYFMLFKYPNETEENYIIDNGEDASLFKYRLKLYLISWYSNTYGNFYDQSGVDDKLKEVKDTLIYKNIAGSSYDSNIPNYITSYYSQNIAKLVVGNIQDIKDSVTNKGITYRDAIIELFIQKSRTFSEGNITLEKEIITNMIIEDLNLAESIIYPKILDILNSKYKINVKGTKLVSTIDVSKLEEIATSEDNVPISWNYSDTFNIDIVATSMTTEFKLQLVRLVNMNNKKQSAISYIPSYLNTNQISNMISILHSNDSGYYDFLNSIKRVAKYEPAFLGILEMFQRSSDRIETLDNKDAIEFVQQYIHIFTTSHTKDITLTDNGHTKCLNENTTKESYVFFKLLKSFDSAVVISELNNIPEVNGSINPMYYEQILDILGFTEYKDAILSKIEDLNVTLNPNKFFVDILNYVRHYNSNKSNGIKFSSSMTNAFIKKVSSMPMWYINLQYINAENNKVFTPTKPAYVTEFTKGIIQGSIITDYYFERGTIDKSKLNDRFKSIIEDPCLKQSPLLNNTSSAHNISMFDHKADGTIDVMNEEQFVKLMSPFRLSAFIDEGTTYMYNNIFGIRSYKFLEAQLRKGIYVIPASDANSTFAVRYDTMSREDNIYAFSQIVLVDRDIFIHGLELLKQGGIEDPNRYGKEKGQAYNFKESAYVKDGKYYTYLEYLIKNPLIVNVNSKEDLINLYNNDIDSFNSLFESTYTTEYVNEYINYQLGYYTSEYNNFRDKIELENKESLDDQLFDSYMTRFIVGHTMNVILSGYQSEYKNDIEANKRISHSNRKSSTIDTLGNSEHKVLVFKDIKRDSPILDKLVDQLPELESVFKNQNSTDGISFITDVTLERLLKNEGKWETYARIVEDLRQGKLINPTQYNRLIEQLKMFGYARRPQNTIFKGSNSTALSSYQFKDSTVVLFRPSIEGTEFETIYDYLIDNNIAQLSSESALKIGFAQAVTLHDKNGKLDIKELDSIVKSSKLDDYVLYMDMADFGPQQDNISHIVDEDTSLATQLVKKAISNLDPTREVYNYYGKNINGNDIDTIIQSRLGISIDHKAEELLYKLGAYDDQGQIKYIDGSNKIELDFNKFKEVLKDLVEGQDISDNIKSILDMDINKNSILMSVPTVYNAFKYILIAQYNKIIKRDLPGTHVTIVPDVFRSPLVSNDTKSIRGVQYSSAYLKDVELNRNGDFTLREEYGYNEQNEIHTLGEQEDPDSTKFHYAEIIINPYHFDIFKEYIKFRKVARKVKENDKWVTKNIVEKYIDIDAIDPEILTMLATRIPVDSKASVMVFRIVGFAMDGASKAIVPLGLINRTGWDFDNDTIYTYHKHIKNKNGTLVPITKDNAYNGQPMGKYEAYLDRVNPEWRNDIMDKLIKGFDIGVIGTFINKYLPDYLDDNINEEDFDIIKSIKEVELLQDVIIKQLDVIYYNDSKQHSESYDAVNKEFNKIYNAIKEIRSNSTDLVTQIKDLNKKLNRLSFKDKKTIRKNILSVINQINILDKSLTKLTTLAAAYNISSDVQSYINSIVKFDFKVNGKEVSVRDLKNDLLARYDIELTNYLNENNGYKKSFDALDGLHQESQEVIDNDLIEAYMGIFSSIAHIQERNRSNDSNTLKRAATIITDRSSYTSFQNFSAPYVQAQFQDRNMAIGYLKSISVNIDGIFSILQRINASFQGKGITRVIKRVDFPRDTDGNIIELNKKLLDQYVDPKDYVIETDENNVIQKVTMSIRHIANNAKNTKLSIVGLPMLDYISEVTPAIFDSVKFNIGYNINEKTLNLFRLLASTPIVEFDGTGNNAFSYAMAIIHHPAIVELTNIAFKTKSTLSKVVNSVVEDYYAKKDDVHMDRENVEYYSTSELLESYDTGDDTININVILAVKQYLDTIKDFDKVSMILKTEQSIRGDYGIIKRNQRIINSIINIDYLNSNAIKGYIKSLLYKRDAIANYIDSIISNPTNIRTNQIVKIKKLLVQAIKNISTFSDLNSFKDNNPIIYNMLLSKLKCEVDGKYVDVASAVFPTLLESDKQSVNSYIQSNLIQGNQLYRNMFSDVFEQHTDDIYNTAAYIANKHSFGMTDAIFSGILDSIVNYGIHKQFNFDNIISDDIDTILTKLNSPFANQEDTYLKTIGYKQIVINNIAKNKIYLELYKKVSTGLKNAKYDLAMKGYSLLEIDINKNAKLKELFEDFKCLTAADKLELIRIVFAEYIDTKNVLHKFNIDIVKRGGYKQFKYDQNDALVIDEHTASLEESLRHKNPFIAYTARDIIFSNILTNGFQFGYNIGKLIPISFMSESYPNDMQHPIEILHTFVKEQSNTVDGIRYIFEDVYDRQNIDILPHIPRGKLHDLKGRSLSIIDNNDVRITDMYIYKTSNENAVSNLIGNKHIVIYHTPEGEVKAINRLYTKMEVNEILEILKDKGIIDTYDELEYSNYNVLIPTSKLLKSEFGDLSIVANNNIHNKNGVYSLSNLIEIIANESSLLTMGESYQYSLFEVIDQLKKEDLAVEVNSIQQEVNDENEINNNNEDNIEPQSISMGVIDLTESSIDTDTDELENTTDIDSTDEVDITNHIAIQTLQIATIISNSIKSTLNHNLDGTELNPIINKISNTIKKSSFQYDDPVQLKGLISNIIEFNNKAIQRLNYIKNDIFKYAGDIDTFINEQREYNEEASSNYMEYAKLLEEASNLIYLIEEINKLNVEGIKNISRGFIEVLLNEQPYIFVTNSVLFEAYKSNIDTDNIEIIENETQYKEKSIVEYINKLQELIDTNYFVNEDSEINKDKLYTYWINGVNVTLTYDKTKVLIQSLTNGDDSLNDIQKNVLFEINNEFYYIKDGISIPNTSFNVRNIILNDIQRTYNKTVKINSKYDDIIESVKHIRDNSSKMKATIDAIRKHQLEFAPKTLVMQSRNGGLLFEKIKEQLYANGHTPSDEEVTITANEFKDAVSGYILSTSDRDTVNWAMSKFGTPFFTSNANVDIVLTQFFANRGRNRKLFNDKSTKYKELLKTHSIDPKDTRLFKYGNLISKYDYSKIKEVRELLFKSISNAKSQYWNDKGILTTSQRRTNLQNALLNARSEISELYGLDAKQIKQLRIFQKYVSRRTNNDLIQEEGLYKAGRMSGLFDAIEDTGISVLSQEEYDEARKEDGFDTYSYLNVTKIFSMGKSDTVDQIYLKLNYDPKYEDGDYKKLIKESPNVESFIFEYNKLIKESIGFVKGSYIKEPNVLPFVTKSTTFAQAKSYLGYKPVHQTKTLIGVDGKENYVLDITSIFDATWYSQFRDDTIELIPTDIDYETALLYSFKKWYTELNNKHKLDIDLDNLTLEMIDNYNDEVIIANNLHKANNQTLDLDVLTEYYLQQLENAKSSNDFATVVTASAIRHNVKGSKTQKLIDLALKNVATGTNNTNKVEQAASIVQRAASLNYMALNYLSGIKNVLKGTLNMVEEASPHGLYNGTDLRNAVGSFIQNIVPNAHKLQHNPDDNKVIALFKFLDDVYEDTRDMGTAAGLTKRMKWINNILYSPNSLGETMMQFSMVIANTKSHRIATNGTIMTYSEYSNFVQNKLMIDILNDEQLKEYKIYRGIVLKQRKSTNKQVTNVDTILNDYMQLLINGRSDNKLSKEQRTKLNDIRLKLKEIKTEFNKLPTVEDTLISVNGEIEIAKDANGKQIISNEAFTKFMRRVSIVNQNLHGVYNKLDRSAIQTMMFGEVIIQFRKWMYSTYSRYAGRHWMQNTFNEGSELVETPIGKPINDLIKAMFSIKNNDVQGSKPSSREILKMIKNIGINMLSTLSNMRTYYNALPTYEKAAMLRSLKTISIIISTGVLAGIAAGALKDRDDDEDKKLLATMSYVLDGLFNEWSVIIPVYGQYTEYKQFKQKLFVAEGIWESLHQLVWYGMVLPVVYDENDPEYEKLYYSRGARKGQSKAGVSFKKLVPVWKQIEKQMNIDEYAKFYNLNNMFIQAR